MVVDLNMPLGLTGVETLGLELIGLMVVGLWTLVALASGWLRG